jgi:hypothetical protein
VTKKWGSMFRIIDFVDNPVRLPQALIILQKP